MNLDYQVFNSQHYPELEKIDITLEKKLGSGSQGTVHLARCKQIQGDLVAKYNYVLGNQELAG